MKFEYQAVDKSNNVVRGITEATDFAHFLEIMWKQRLYPIEVKKLTKSNHKAFGDLKRLKRLKNKIEGVESGERFNLIPSEIKKVLAPPKKKFKIDWGYIVYILIIVSVIVIAILDANHIVK